MTSDAEVVNPHRGRRHLGFGVGGLSGVNEPSCPHVFRASMALTLRNPVSPSVKKPFGDNTMDARNKSGRDGRRGVRRPQFFNRYPVLKIHPIAPRHTTINPSVAAKLIPTPTSAWP